LKKRRYDRKKIKVIKECEGEKSAGTHGGEKRISADVCARESTRKRGVGRERRGRRGTCVGVYAATYLGGCSFLPST